VTGFNNFNNNTSKRILNELEKVYLRLRKIEEGVAVIEFRANKGGGDGTSCSKIRTNTTKLTNARITRFGQRRYLVRDSEMFITRWHGSARVL